MSLTVGGDINSFGVSKQFHTIIKQCTQTCYDTSNQFNSLNQAEEQCFRKCFFRN